MTCSTVWSKSRTLCVFDDRPWSTHSAPSKPGWEQTHFLTRTLKRVSTEMSLHVLAYNLKRVIAILGVGPLIAAIRT
jgi:hypothetical protein